MGDYDELRSALVAALSTWLGPNHSATAVDRLMPIILDHMTRPMGKTDAEMMADAVDGLGQIAEIAQAHRQKMRKLGFSEEYAENAAMMVHHTLIARIATQQVQS